MKAPFALAALLGAAAFAGCTASLPENPNALVGGWTLDCSLPQADAWKQDCLVRATTTAGSKTEAWLAVNPADPDNVVMSAKDNNPESSTQCTWNGLAVTKDGGVTWTPVVIGGKASARQPTDPWFGYACNTDPMFTFAPDGKLHYVMELYNLVGPDGSGPLGPDPVAGRALLLAGWKLLLVTSHDGGLTWPDVTTMMEADGVTAINDYSRVAVNPKTGTVLTAINTFSGGPFIYASAVYNRCSVTAVRGGAATTWQDPLVPGAARPTCMEIVASPEGKVVLLYSDGFGSAGAASVATSDDDGASFSQPSPAFTFTAIPGRFPGGAYRTGTNFEAHYDDSVGPHHGRLYVLYAQNDGSATELEKADANLYLRWSDDDGQTWSGPVRVNPAEPAPARHQFMANLAVATDGSVHVFYTERGASADDFELWTHHAISLDGGQTWTATRVSTVGWDGNRGVHQEGFPFVGDYIGVGAAGDVVWAGVPDASSTSVPTLAGAKLVKLP